MKFAVILLSVCLGVSYVASQITTTWGETTSTILNYENIFAEPADVWQHKDVTFPTVCIKLSTKLSRKNMYFQRNFLFCF